MYYKESITILSFVKQYPYGTFKNKLNTFEEAEVQKFPVFSSLERMDIQCIYVYINVFGFVLIPSSEQAKKSKISNLRSKHTSLRVSLVPSA